MAAAKNNDPLVRRTNELEVALYRRTASADSAWAETVRSALLNVETALSEHQALLRSPDGPAETIHAVSQEIMPKIDRKLVNLSQEDAALLNEARWLRTLSEAVAGAATSVPHPEIDDIRLSGGHLVDALRRMKHTENTLVLNEITTDYGAAD